MGLRDKITALENFRAIEDAIPSDTAAPCFPMSHVARLTRANALSGQVLDLGCGEGNSIDQFRLHAPQLGWHGVDIQGSPEANRRHRQDGLFKTFDGINLRYPDAMFSMIYCNQVLEHVRHPDPLVAEALRVLKPGGYFVGAVSYLEPFHSYSLFNFTPYGVKRVFTDAGFELLEMRPGVDASHLINRQLVNRTSYLRFVWKRSYLHAYVALVGRLSGLGVKEVNFLKLMFAGHITFLARKALVHGPAAEDATAQPHTDSGQP